ncbi:MAG: TRAP transporter substrate-binding protein DctP [Rhodospirillaceae bacterium]
MNRIVIGGAVAAMISGAAIASASATDLKVLSSWNKDNWPTYAVLEEFEKNVKAIGGGKVNLVISGPEVVPAFEQLQPVSAGVFDILYTHGIYHSGSKGLGFTFDAIGADPEARRKGGLIDYVDQYYQKHNNLKMLGMVANSNSGYHIFLKEPLSANSDFSGRKIRGTLSYHGIIRLLGGSPVVLPGGQIYSGLEKGVIDGAAWPAAGMLSMKHYEVAKYKMRPTFGTTNTGFWVNLAKWKSLSQEDRKILEDAAKKTEIDMLAVGDKILADENAELAKHGVKDTDLTPEMAEKVKMTFQNDMWEIAKKCCADGSEELRELARKAGLTN